MKTNMFVPNGDLIDDMVLLTTHIDSDIFNAVHIISQIYLRRKDSGFTQADGRESF